MDSRLFIDTHYEAFMIGEKKMIGEILQASKRTGEVCSINYIRLFCAYLVVAIHAHPFEEISKPLSFVATSIIPRIAVPFFFAVSGYFYIRSLQKGKCPFLKYVKSLLSTYVIWSTIYFAVNFYNTISIGTFSLKGFIADCVVRFVWLGSFYHFWYFPALFICIIITTISFKMKKMNVLYFITLALYIIGVMGCAYYQIAIQVPIVSKVVTYSGFENIRRVFMMGLPFFMLGYLLCVFDKKKRKGYYV